MLDYLDSLTWDGVERIDRWLIDYAGAEDTPYVRAVGRLMLLAAVRRVRHPGTKFDEMVVLELANSGHRQIHRASNPRRQRRMVLRQPTFERRQ